MLGTAAAFRVQSFSRKGKHLSFGAIMRRQQVHFRFRQSEKSIQ